LYKSYFWRWETINMNGDGQRRSQGPIIITPSDQPGQSSHIRLRMGRISSKPPQKRSTYLGRMAGRCQRGQFNTAMDHLLESGAIITTHDVPDPDGYGGAHALEKWMRMKSPSCRVDIVVSQRIPNTDRLIERLGMDVKGWQDIDPTDKRPIIIVDTNSMALLTGARILGNDVHLVIDHHQQDECSPDSRFSITNIKSISACEIIASLLPAEEITPEIALALACGLICDSERLKLADDHSLMIFKRLRERSGVMRHDIEEMVFPRLDPMIVHTLLEEMKQVEKVVRHGRLIAVAPTHVEPSAILSTALREMGADVVAVLGEISDSMHKLSLRVNVKDAYERGLHAHEIARELGSRCGVPERMKPGGHIDKAGGLLPGQYKDLSELALETIIERMDGIFGKP